MVDTTKSNGTSDPKVDVTIEKNIQTPSRARVLIARITVVIMLIIIVARYIIDPLDTVLGQITFTPIVDQALTVLAFIIVAAYSAQNGFIKTLMFIGIAVTTTSLLAILMPLGVIIAMAVAVVSCVFMRVALEGALTMSTRTTTILIKPNPS